MSNKPPRCDSYNRRLRKNQHELLLRDAETDQTLGHYHARPECQEAALKYMVPGVALRGTYFHPERCGDDLALCDGGLSEVSA